MPLSSISSPSHSKILLKGLVDHFSAATGMAPNLAASILGLIQDMIVSNELTLPQMAEGAVYNERTIR
jgi:hypothetical protein